MSDLMTDRRIPLPNDRFLLVREKGISIYDNHATPGTDCRVRDLDEYEEMYVRAAFEVEPRLVTGKPIEWEAAKSKAAIPDLIGDNGFYINYEPSDDPEKPYQASCGEDDQKSFATVEEAKAWCQDQLNHWIAQYAVVTSSPVAQTAEPSPEMVTVPRNPPESMWGGLARDLIMAWEMFGPKVEGTREHLRLCGYEVLPEWLEKELTNKVHLAKGDRAVLIYKAMIAATENP